MYGTVNARPPNRAKGTTESPSVHDFLSPKNRVIIMTMKVGMRVPVIP